MKDKLIGRVGRIISGSFHSLVSALENAVPESVLEEAIREIDAAIDEVRTELGKVIAQKHLANNRLMDENKKHEDLSAKIELAVAEQRDDLAEAAVALQLDIEAQIPVLEATINDCGVQEKELEGYITALLAKKRQMHDELRQFKQTQAEAQQRRATGTPASSGSSVEGKVAKAESAFDRVIEGATGLGSIGSAANKKNASQLAELEDLARKNRIEERMAAIKSKMNKD